MSLDNMITVLGDAQVLGKSRNIPVSGLTYRSSDVKKGHIFVAIPGFKSDGRNYVAQAMEQGAIAIVFEGKFFDKLRATQIRVSGARLALARLSSAFFAHPTNAFYLCGVTGTNGKTTLTYLMEALWQAAQRKTGVLGTINYRINGTVVREAQATTPESLDLQNYFFLMKKKKVSHAVVEVSSHGLDLDRVESSQFNSCVFTNLTRDHLDFHKTFESYYRAKEKLFLHHLAKSSKKDKLAVVCVEDKYGLRLADSLKKAKVPLMTYGFSNHADVHPEHFELGLQSGRVVLKIKNRSLEFSTKLIGRFNLLNTMAAVAVGMHSGLKEPDIVKGFENFKGVPGRLEQPAPLVFVDYAHTPDALKNVLKTLRALSPRKLITVFGCGGDRDKTKRPQMGKEAGVFSDIVIVTSDNPRMEDPEKIMGDIMPGLKRLRQKEIIKEPDRKKAIEAALHLKGPNDVVLIAGKGHENYQMIGAQKYPFSDQHVVKEYFGLNS